MIGLGEMEFTEEGRGPFILTLKNIRMMAVQSIPLTHTYREMFSWTLN